MTARNLGPVLVSSAPALPRCGLCGRVLADPVSRARGVGPVCFRASGGRTAPRVPVPEAGPIPGQTELPLVEHQPSLWSL